jgi:hypothetical protein
MLLCCSRKSAGECARAYDMPQRGMLWCAHAQANSRKPCSRITASGLLLACAGGWAQTAAAQQRGEKTALRTSNAPATSTPRNRCGSLRPEFYTNVIFLFTFLFKAFERPNQPPSPRAHRSGRRLGLCAVAATARGRTPPG